MSVTKCVHCRSSETIKKGSYPDHKQRYWCKSCKKYFRKRYSYQACKLNVHKEISKFSGTQSVRQISQHLKISNKTAWYYSHLIEKTYQTRIQQIFSIRSSCKHVISFSGGKDSTALVLWAKAHLPPEKTVFIFCDTGFEAPETVAFISEMNLRFMDNKLVILRSQRFKNFEDLVLKKGRTPSTKARFCTEELKIRPFIEWILEQKENLAVYQGIRAEESPSRAMLPVRCNYFEKYLEYQQNPKNFKKTPLLFKQVMQWLETYKCFVERPLFYWREKDILKTCRSQNALNPLYDKGFKRVGCYPCIMCRKEEIRLIAQQSPQYIGRIRRIETKLGRSFFPFDKVPDSLCKTPFIDDVVRWAHVELQRGRRRERAVKIDSCENEQFPCE